MARGVKIRVVTSDGARKTLLGGGERAVKAAIESGVRESLQTIPIVLPKKTKQKGHEFYEVPMVKFRWRWGARKYFGGYSSLKSPR